MAKTAHGRSPIEAVRSEFLEATRRFAAVVQRLSDGPLGVCDDAAGFGVAVLNSA